MGSYPILDLDNMGEPHISYFVIWGYTPYLQTRQYGVPPFLEDVNMGLYPILDCGNMGVPHVSSKKYGVTPHISLKGNMGYRHICNDPILIKT